MGWKDKEEKLGAEHKAILVDMFMKVGTMIREPQSMRSLLSEENLGWLPAEPAQANTSLSNMAAHAFGIISRFMGDDYEEHKPSISVPKILREHGRAVINKEALLEYAAQDMMFRAEFEDHYDAALAALQALLSAQLEVSSRAAQQTDRGLS